MEGDLETVDPETVQPYQFKPVASDSPAESFTDNNDPGDKDSTAEGWWEFACMAIKDNPSVFQKAHYDILL